jgi:hypothetical protein
MNVRIGTKTAALAIQTWGKIRSKSAIHAGAKTITTKSIPFSSLLELPRLQRELRGQDYT